MNARTAETRDEAGASESLKMLLTSCGSMSLLGLLNRSAASKTPGARIAKSQDNGRDRLPDLKGSMISDAVWLSAWRDRADNRSLAVSRDETPNNRLKPIGFLGCAL
jgi:hypothetical protein